MESKHATNGVNCVTCHTDHEAAYGRKPWFSPKSAGNAIPSNWRNSGRAAIPSRLNECEFKENTWAFRRKSVPPFCERCHLVEKKCNSCHASHDFSAKAANEPEACGNCHLGPDHPHKEMYESSLHGIVYKLTQNPERAPRCVTCHMPGGTHDTSFGIARGPCWNSGRVVDLKENPISRGEGKKTGRDDPNLHGLPFQKVRLRNSLQMPTKSKKKPLNCRKKGKK